MKNIIIVGAGISGLSFAYECLKRNHKVTLVENTSTIGGLARSVFHNNCWLDIGVHVLYLKDPEVRAKVAEVLPPEHWLQVRRNGKLYLKGRYIDWPPTINSMIQLPPFFSMQVALDQLFRRSHNGPPSDYEQTILNLYGPTLYQAFFKPLTQKFLQSNPVNIHSDWAFSSLRAATKIEDKTFNSSQKYLTQGTDTAAHKDFNVFKFLLNSLQADKNQEPFYYFKNGFGELVNAYSQKIQELGGKILLNHSVSHIEREGTEIRRVTIGGEPHNLDQLVWTGNPFSLCQLLNIEAPRLPFLHSKFVFAYLKRCAKTHQVCYYADPDISFVRGTILSNHSKTIIRNPHLSDVICLEFTFPSPQALSVPLAQLKDQLIKDLLKVKIIQDPGDVESLFEINAPYSYPILTLDYREKTAALNKHLSQFQHLTVLGRQATFNYENSDIIIKNVLHHPFFKDTAMKPLETSTAL